MVSCGLSYWTKTDVCCLRRDRSLDARGVSEAPLLKRLAAAEFPAPNPDRPCSAAELPAPPPPTPQGSGADGAVTGGTAPAAKQIQHVAGGALAAAGKAVAVAVAGNAAGGKVAAPADPEEDSQATAPIDPAFASSSCDTSVPTAPPPPEGVSPTQNGTPSDVDAGDEAQSPAVRRVAAAAAAPEDGSPARHLSGALLRGSADWLLHRNKTAKTQLAALARLQWRANGRALPGK